MNTFLNMHIEHINGWDKNFGTDTRIRCIEYMTDKNIDQRISERGVYEQWHARMVFSPFARRRAARVSNGEHKIKI